MGGDGNHFWRSLWETDRYVRTPIVLQMEATECGAAALAIVLAYYGKTVPLEELRVACGVSRDGSKAGNMFKAALQYGLVGKGFKKEPEELKQYPCPLIVHWNFNHFVVIEGFGRNKVYLNDPASGRRTVAAQEFHQAFTGIVLVLQPGSDFAIGKVKTHLWGRLRPRLDGAETALFFIFFVGALLVVPGLVVPTFTRVFVDDILLAGRQDWLFPLLAGMLVTAIVQMVLSYSREYYLTRMETKLAVSTSSKFIWQILRLPVAFFAQRYLGDIISRIQLNDKVARAVSGQLAGMVLDVILVGFFLSLMFVWNGTLALVGMAVAFANVAFLRYINQRRFGENLKFIQDKGKLSGVVMGGLQIIETIKAGSNETDLFDKLIGHQIKTANGEQNLEVSSQLLNAFPGALTALANTVVLVAGGFEIITGRMTIGTLMAFQLLMANFVAPINRLVSFGGLLQEVEGDLCRLDDVLNYRIDRQNWNEQEKEWDGGVKLSGHVEFRQVSFGYSRLEPPLITDLSFVARPGHRIAIVGASGSGKSTIAKLAAGLYQPWSGEVLFDGKPREQHGKRVVNNSVTCVDQDIFLFAGTIRANLTMWDDDVPLSEMIRAAQDADIHNEITSLPVGYDTRLEEGARNFSGGQRQRMEIARSLVINPTVLVLDEATSALDPVTEKKVMESIQRRGCTCLIVAHRLSTIRDCDEILVLQEGKVVQRGTHDQLKNREGLYRQLISSE